MIEQGLTRTTRRKWRQRLTLKQAALLAVAIFGFGAISCWLVNAWMVWSTRAATFGDPRDVPENHVGLVLGTSPLIAGHWANPFFEGRMDLAADLYRAGKVKHLLVSGDNSRREYDEPTAMRDALVKRGVPAERVTLDYAGFRTLDTMARAKAVFGLDRCTIVTDDFHLARCIFLARAHGLDAIGCAAPPVRMEWSRKTRLREIASRCAAWLDVCVLHTKPKFYGPKVEIPLRETAAD